MKQLTLQQAVNRIAQCIDGSIVSDLEDPQNRTVIQIQEALNTANEKAQTDNRWRFNKAPLRRLTADDDGNITLPTNMVYISFRTASSAQLPYLTVRGNKVYDSLNATYNIGGTVEVEGHDFLEFNELPLAIQSYVIEKAKLEFFGLDTHLSAARVQMYQLTAKEAYQAALRWDSQQDFGNLNTGNGRDRLNTGNRWGWWA